MLFLAAGKDNLFQWTPEQDLVMRSPERGQIWKDIAAALNSFSTRNLELLQVKSCARSVFTFNFKIKTTAARRRESLHNRIIQVVKNNKFATVRLNHRL